MKTIKISDDATIADIIKKNFINITKICKLKPTETETNELKLSEILDMFKNDQSTLKI